MQSCDNIEVGKILLQTSGLTKSFRGLVALRDHALTLHENEILGVIGPNGSGKSTFFNLISGFSKPNSGQINFRGKSIVGYAASHIVELGIARTFQGSRLFASLTVADNVLAAAQLRNPIGPLSAVLRGRRYQSRLDAAQNITTKLLNFMGLSSGGPSCRRPALRGSTQAGNCPRLGN